MTWEYQWWFFFYLFQSGDVWCFEQLNSFAVIDIYKEDNIQQLVLFWWLLFAINNCLIARHHMRSWIGQWLFKWLKTRTVCSESHMDRACLNIKTAVVWTHSILAAHLLIIASDNVIQTALGWIWVVPVVIQSPCASHCIACLKIDCCPGFMRIMRYISEHKTLRGLESLKKSGI